MICELEQVPRATSELCMILNLRSTLQPNISFEVASSRPSQSKCSGISRSSKVSNGSTFFFKGAVKIFQNLRFTQILGESWAVSCEISAQKSCLLNSCRRVLCFSVTWWKHQNLLFFYVSARRPLKINFPAFQNADCGQISLRENAQY